MKKLFESYSKVIETIFMTCYLYGIVMGTWAVVQDPSLVDSLLVYIGGSTTIATSFYFWKARCENLQKYKQVDPQLYQQIIENADSMEEPAE